MYDRSSTFGETLESPAARAVLETFLPGVAASPMATQYRGLRLGQLVAIVPELRDDTDAQDRFLDALGGLADGASSRAPYAPAIAPDPAYEGDDVPAGSAELRLPGATPRWGVVEVTFDGPSHGNPFVDVELTATFRHGDRELVAGGFYDGDGIYRIRMLAEDEGDWSFETRSSAR